MWRKECIRTHGMSILNVSGVTSPQSNQSTHANQCSLSNASIGRWASALGIVLMKEGKPSWMSFALFWISGEVYMNHYSKQAISPAGTAEKTN